MIYSTLLYSCSGFVHHFSTRLRRWVGLGDWVSEKGRVYYIVVSVLIHGPDRLLLLFLLQNTRIRIFRPWVLYRAVPTFQGEKRKEEEAICRFGSLPTDQRPETRAYYGITSRHVTSQHVTAISSSPAWTNAHGHSQPSARVLTAWRSAFVIRRSPSRGRKGGGLQLTFWARVSIYSFRVRPAKKIIKRKQ